MKAPRLWLVVWFVGLGGHTALAWQNDADMSHAARLWDEGQKAMRAGQPARAIGFYEKSLAADPARTRNHLSLAAAHMEAGDEQAACRHLDAYVQAHPEHTLMRSHYAELLLRLHRAREARRQFERFCADALEKPGEFSRHLVHTHTRLMEIARAEEDEYGQRLHRGLGLYWLARSRAAVEAGPEELPAEGLLHKATAELHAAWRMRPGEARPSWYLYAVWSTLGQRQAALAWLRRAREAAPFSDLSAAEQRALVLADLAGGWRPAR
jgi:tetratricopeptide (TPR) repeat protein